MLAEVLRHLRCPICAAVMANVGGALRCEHGHSFDLARQGYVNLLVGTAPEGTETTAMVAARSEVLAAGHLDFLTEALVQAALVQAPLGQAATASAGAEADARAGLVVDAGAGTGHHLAAVLRSLPDRYGLALDLAKPAVRRAARAHPRAGAAVCDIWRGLPLHDGCAGLLLNVFAPRNPAEFHRVLRPGGALLVATPGPHHLVELIKPVGLLAVDPAKSERLRTSLERAFEPRGRHRLARTLVLNRHEAAAFVAMGPSAWHTDPQAVRSRLDSMPEPIRVTAEVDLRSYRRRRM